MSIEYPPPKARSNSRLFLILGLVVAGVLFVCCLGVGLVGFFATDGFKALMSVAASPTSTRVAIAVPTAAATALPRATVPATAQKPGATAITVPTSTSVAVTKGKPLKMNSPEYGVQAFLWWRPETADRDVGLARDAGLTWVKQQFAWRDIEGAGKGKFDWEHADLAVNTANSKGVDLLARVDNAPDWAAPGCFDSAKKTMGPAKNSQDWADFLKAFVTRYKGKVRAYEIWNEPNLAREWCSQAPNPVQYAALLKLSYSTIKSIDPNAMIISAGLTPTTQNDARAMPDMTFLDKLYAAMNNNSNGYFDVLGIHAAGFKAPPEMSPDDVAKNATYNNGDGPAGRIYCFRHAEDMRKIMVDHGDSTKQIAILEFGWTMDNIHPAYSWFSVDEQTHGKYVVGAFQYAKQHWSGWIGAMIVIYLANPDWTKDNEEYWWSIDQPDGTPRAAYVRIKAMQK